jgi:hypothetical protein
MASDHSVPRVEEMMAGLMMAAFFSGAAATVILGGLKVLWTARTFVARLER